jgi:hypothetical protein
MGYNGEDRARCRCQRPALKIKPGQFVLITTKVVVSGRVINHRSPLAVRMPPKVQPSGRP